MAFDWTSFIVRININAPAQKLYDAWATRDGMEHWFLRLSEYKKPDGDLRHNLEHTEAGDNYKWLWHGWPDDTVEYGKILEANGKDFFKFSFGKAGNCSVKIFRDIGENFVEITQDNIPDDDHGRTNWHLGCKTGWTFYLDNMKSLYEGGIDLRNKNILLKGLVNA
jgi:uncharacterized protein YndB with AHSA1/START domain